MVVVVVVDGQQVSVHVCVANQQLCVGDTMDMLQQAVELIEPARLRPVQGEPAELGSELGTCKRGRGQGSGVKARTNLFDSYICIGTRLHTHTFSNVNTNIFADRQFQSH